jgi:hypothetical protein
MPFVGIGTLPPPFSPASVPLPPETGGRGHTSLRVGGWGEVPIPTRGVHCGTLYMYVLCGTEGTAKLSRVLCSVVLSRVVSRLKQPFTNFSDQALE